MIGIFCARSDIASAQTPSELDKNTQVRSQPPSPINATDTWTKLSRISALHGDEVSKAQVEAIFGVKLANFAAAPNNKNAILFEHLPVTTQPFNLYLTIYPHETDFTFEWSHYIGERYMALPQLPEGICIDVDSVTNTLDKQGWVLSSHGSNAMEGVHMPDTYEYKFGTHNLRASFDWPTKCLVGLTIS